MGQTLSQGQAHKCRIQIKTFVTLDSSYELFAGDILCSNKVSSLTDLSSTYALTWKNTGKYRAVYLIPLIDTIKLSVLHFLSLCVLLVQAQRTEIRCVWMSLPQSSHGLCPRTAVLLLGIQGSEETGKHMTLETGSESSLPPGT